MAAAAKPYSGFNILARGEWRGKDLLFYSTAAVRCSSLQPAVCSHTARSDRSSSKVVGAMETYMVTEDKIASEEKGLQVNHEAFVAPIFVFSPRQGCLATLWQSLGPLMGDVRQWISDATDKFTVAPFRCIACKLRKLEILRQSSGPSLVPVTLLWHLLHLLFCRLSLVRKYCGS